MDYDPSMFEPNQDDRFEPNKEPSALVTTAARDLRHLYIAMIREGFSPHETMTILGAMLAGSAGTR